MKHIISLGAGVQSSTMALMAANGEITPMPVAAIFADTKSEPASVYRWLDWLENQLPFPVIRVGREIGIEQAGTTLRHKKTGESWVESAVPAFIANPDGTTGKVQRQCTYTWKILELEKCQRKIASVPHACKNVMVTSWIGISLDEVQRMKPSRHKWCEHRWPLVDMRIRRMDCLEWMKSRGYPAPPRSACVFCPYHSDSEWRRLKTEEPDEFERACVFDDTHRELNRQSRHTGGLHYLHRSLQPIRDIDFSSDTDRGQMLLWDDFTNECEGMCGV